MDFCKLFYDVLPAWLSGIVAIVAIIISCKSNRKSNKLQEEIADDNNKLLKAHHSLYKVTRSVTH